MFCLPTNSPTWLDPSLPQPQSQQQMRTSSSTAVAIGWISLTVLLPLCLLWLWNTSGIKLEQEEPTHHILRTTSTTATNGSKHEQNRVGVADLDGEWLHNNGANKDRTFDSPECCDWGIRENKNNAPSCNVSLAQHMEWGNSSNKHHGLYTGNPNYPAMVGYMDANVMTLWMNTSGNLQLYRHLMSLKHAACWEIGECCTLEIVPLMRQRLLSWTHSDQQARLVKPR